MIDTDWKVWFKNEIIKYKNYRTVHIILLIASILLAVLLSNSMIYIRLCIYAILIVNVIEVIAYNIRINDTIKALSCTESAKRRVKIRSIRHKEINGIYCYNYMKACVGKPKKGNKYDLKILEHTAGKYVVYWEDLGKCKDNEFLAVKEKEKLEELEIDMEKEMELIRQELMEQGIDIDEVRKEVTRHEV